jgi:hypothetical protein
MILPPAVTVHGRANINAALKPGLPVTLLSARGAALFAGVSWWRALIADGRAAFPATPGTDILDCADAPGRAMAALRAGQRLIVLAPSCPAYAAVAAAGAANGATVLPARPASLDMAARDAQRRLRAWLTAMTGAPS